MTLADIRPFMVLRTLKQRRRKPGRSTKEEQIQDLTKQFRYRIRSMLCDYENTLPPLYLNIMKPFGQSLMIQRVTSSVGYCALLRVKHRNIASGSAVSTQSPAVYLIILSYCCAMRTQSIPLLKIGAKLGYKAASLFRTNSVFA